MIRERLEQDIDRLVEVMSAMDYPSAGLSRAESTRWLTGTEALASWVFDMAPVSVAPTRKVIAHAQLRQAGPEIAAAEVDQHSGHRLEDLVIIDKLFVQRGTFEEGITRFLLRESVRFAHHRGGTTLIDLAANPFLSREFCGTCGFVPIESTDPAILPMLHRPTRRR